MTASRKQNDSRDIARLTQIADLTLSMTVRHRKKEGKKLRTLWVLRILLYEDLQKRKPPYGTASVSRRGVDFRDAFPFENHTVVSECYL